MNKIGIVPIFCGLAAGVVVIFLLMMGRPEAPTPPEPAPKEGGEQKEEVLLVSQELEKENENLRERIRSLEEELDALTNRPDREPPKELVPKEEGADLHTQFFRLSENGISAYGGKAFLKLLKALKGSPEEARELLLERLQNAETAAERFLAAALLEGLYDPKAIPALGLAAKEDSDDLVRRMASHALALIGTEEARDPLLICMNEDKDWGVRVNSAYGLAKLGDGAGLAMLKQSYYSEDTPPEYRLTILGALADVADPATAPIFREILTGSKDMGYLLTAIGAVEKMKDKGSLLELRAILHSDHSSSVKGRAEEAIYTIQN